MIKKKKVKRALPKIHDGMSQEDILALGVELSQLQKTLGWRAFEGIMKAHRDSLGTSSLRDKTRTRDYWIGQLDCIEQIQASIQMIVESAREVAKVESPKNTQRLFRMVTAGSGGL